MHTQKRFLLGVRTYIGVENVGSDGDYKAPHIIALAVDTVIDCRANRLQFLHITRSHKTNLGVFCCFLNDVDHVTTK